MVNPVLSVLFNLFLVGTALAVITAMIQEYLESRRPSVGRGASELRGTRPAEAPLRGAGKNFRRAA